MKIKLTKASEDIKNTLKNFCVANTSDEKACNKAVEDLKQFKTKNGAEIGARSSNTTLMLARAFRSAMDEEETARKGMFK